METSDVEPETVRHVTDALRAAPEVPVGDVFVLWPVRFYDGPLSGVCEWNGRDLWFECVADVWLSPDDVALLPAPPPSATEPSPGEVAASEGTGTAALPAADPDVTEDVTDDGDDGDELVELRVFHLVELSADEMAGQWARHARFRRHVGHHTDVHVGAPRHVRVAPIRSRGEQGRFYDSEPARTSDEAFEGRPPVATFRW